MTSAGSGRRRGGGGGRRESGEERESGRAFFGFLVGVGFGEERREFCGLKKIS